MTSRTCAAAIGCAVVLSLISAVHAAVDVGDTPTMAFRSHDGKNIDLKDLRGKIVLIDFWATWCGPCMAEAGHMVAVHEQWGPKGLVLIGVSLDDNRQAMLNVVKQHNFNWPQHFDGRGWGNKYAGEWGVKGIPRTFLLDTSGKVVWIGHPAGMDSAIEKAFQDTPPMLVDPALAAKANETLAQVEASIEAGDQVAAIKQFASLPPGVRQDAKIDERAKTAEEKLQTAAQAMLADVEPMIEQKQFAQAAARLHELIAILGTSDAATQAKQRLSQLNAMPEAQAAVAAAEKNAKANEELAVAQKLAAEQKDEQAYTRFKQIARMFDGTEAASTAAAAARKYEADPAFVQRANESAAGGKAKGLLGLAQSYRSAGRAEQARAKYQEVIDQFPGTSYAETAAKELAAMGK